MLRSPTWSVVWSVLRLAMALVIAAAIVTQLVASAVTAASLDRDIVTTYVNFFSFFTILSNALAAIVLAWAAVWFFTRRPRPDVEPPALSVALVSVSTYMIITGIVYNTILRGIVLPVGSEPVAWSNETLHLIGPLFLLADVLVGALRRALPWRAVWIVVAFPIVWVVYTLVRGPLVVNPVTGTTPWYPYPFLNPANFANGYLGVSVYVVGIAAAIIGVAFAIVWVGRRRGVTPVDA